MNVSLHQRKSRELDNGEWLCKVEERKRRAMRRDNKKDDEEKKNGK